MSQQASTTMNPSNSQQKNTKISDALIGKEESQTPSHGNTTNVESQKQND